MKTTVNKVEICGFLGKDAEVKTLANGQSIIHLSVATAHEYKNRDGACVKRTTWHKVVMWKLHAGQMAEQFKKGRQVHIKGRIINRWYTGKSGKNHFITEIVAQKTEVAA